MLASPCLAAEWPASVPSVRQLLWSTHEFTVFFHFGVNTLSGSEWGSGQEQPKTFNPTALDAGQWVRAIQSAGASGVVLICKHHDGFCLWPSQFTEHSVRNSPWREGNGDLVREVSEACRKAGLRFGVYLSPGDLHETTYGRDSAAYNEYFRNQLRELLTNYGEISEVWFDGAQPSRLKQAYDFPSYYRLVRELQPNAVIVSKGPDVRWVGNEAGIARESEWSVIPLPTTVEDYDWPDLRAQDLGSRERLKGAKTLHWYPAVCDVSLGPDWFWDPRWDRELKSLDQLKRIYESSVGRNAGLLLNIGPDRRGLIPDSQVRRLKEFGDWMRTSFSTNLLAGVELTLQASPGTNDVAVFEAQLGKTLLANTIVLQEDIAKGQYVERFTVEGKVGDRWFQLATGTTIGRKRILHWPLRSIDGLRLTIHETRGQLHILPPELYRVRW
jgi:alpha-L-fucosidase